MDIRQERSDDVLVIAPVGRVDSSSSGPLERRLLSLLGEGENVFLIDLAAVEYISSAGLRVLLLVANRLRERGGQIVLCALGQSVREVFELAGFTSLFAIEPSREAARARLLGPG